MNEIYTFHWFPVFAIFFEVIYGNYVSPFLQFSKTNTFSALIVKPHMKGFICHLILQKWLFANRQINLKVQTHLTVKKSDSISLSRFVRFFRFIEISSINPFQPSVAFQIEISHVICFANGLIWLRNPHIQLR